MQTLTRGDVPASVRGPPSRQPDHAQDKLEPGQAARGRRGRGTRGAHTDRRRPAWQLGVREASGRERHPRVVPFPRHPNSRRRRLNVSTPLQPRHEGEGLDPRGSPGSALLAPVTGLGPSQRWDPPEGSREPHCPRGQRKVGRAAGRPEGRAPRTGFLTLLSPQHPPPRTPLFPKEKVLRAQEG